MKIPFFSRNRRSAGYALLLVFGVVLVSVMYFAATWSRTWEEAHLNDRSGQELMTMEAAEAATELAVARIRYDYLTAGMALVTNNLGIYRTGCIPRTSDNAYWNQFNFSDGAGHGNQLYISCIQNSNWGQDQNAAPGLYSFNSTYRVLANASLAGSSYGITNAVQQDIILASVPIFQFAIYYNSLMEFTWTAPFTVNGRVHANGPIYTGTSSALIFNGQVTTTSTQSSPANDGHTTSQYTTAPVFNGGLTTNGYSLLLPLGTNNVHSIIDQPPAGESPMSQVGSNRMENLANVVLLVSNSSVTVRVQSSENGLVPGADGSSNLLTFTNLSQASLNTNLPFLSITNKFTDQRENKTAYVTQIDVGKYSTWLSTNSAVASKFSSADGTYPVVLYVADDRTSNNASSFTAVRLTNGAVPPSNGGLGFTVATADPLYIWGNYNCTNSSYLGTSNTSSSFPTSVVADALTILSPAWKDSASGDAFGSGVRSASNDTVDTAIIAGIVYSTGTSSTTFSGGVMNLPRLLEDWSSATLTLNTSIINLYASTVATNQFQNPGAYYYAPAQRNFSFDLNFENPAKNPPPATPNLMVLTRGSWAAAPANTTNYYVPQ